MFVKLMTFPVVSRDRKLAIAVRVVKCSRLYAPKITCIASGANKSEKKKDPEKQYNELGKGRRHDRRC